MTLQSNTVRELCVMIYRSTVLFTSLPSKRANEDEKRGPRMLTTLRPSVCLLSSIFFSLPYPSCYRFTLRHTTIRLDCVPPAALPSTLSSNRLRRL